MTFWGDGISLVSAPVRKCIFSTEFVRAEVDPRVQAQWQSAYGKGAPFGKLRQIWKEVHCTKVDPYNTGCPYAQSDCALAFLVGVERTLGAHPARPTGYFRAVALNLGLDRADNKPLARDTLRRTDVHKEGDTEGRRSGAQEGQGMRSATNRPVRISELLGTYHPRPHQGPITDSQEGDK